MEGLMQKYKVHKTGGQKWSKHSEAIIRWMKQKDKTEEKKTLHTDRSDTGDKQTDSVRQPEHWCYKDNLTKSGSRSRV